MTEEVLSAAFTVLTRLYKLVQNRDENLKSAKFLSNRLDVLWQVLTHLDKNTSLATVAATERVLAQMLDSYDLCEEIFKRGTFMKLWKSKKDREELIAIGEKLDMCINDLGIALSVDQQRLLGECRTSIQEVSDKVDQVLAIQQGNAEQVRSIVTDKRAFAFYEKWFTGTLILTIEFFLAGLFAELREEGIEDTPGLRQVITRNVDKNADGVVDIHELNEFFRDIWVESGVDDLLREGEEQQEQEHAFGRLFSLPASLTVIRCNEPTTFTNGQIFRLIPQGFLHVQGYRTQDRTTLIGTDASGARQNDIILAPNDPFCAKNQAVINHTSDGYKLVEIEVNGLTRVKVQVGEEVAMVAGLVLSFGLNIRVRVVNVYYAEGQTEITESNGQVRNIFHRNAPVDRMVLVDEQDGTTVVQQALEVRSCVLELQLFYGHNEDRTIQCSSQKGNYYIGRSADKSIPIMDNDISGDHGCFFHDGQKWYYKYGPTPPRNGTWKGVSNYDQFSQGKQSEGVHLRENDVILIGQQQLLVTLG